MLLTLKCSAFNSFYTDHRSCMKEMKDNQTRDAFIPMQCKLTYKRGKFEGASTTVPRRQTTECSALIHSPQSSLQLELRTFPKCQTMVFALHPTHNKTQGEMCSVSGLFLGTTGHGSRTDPPSHCPHWAEALVSQHVGVWKVTLS